MGIKIATHVFQKVIIKLTKDIENAKAYLDNLLILTNKSFNDHLTKSKRVLARLTTVDMKFNASNSRFFSEQVEYLGYWITRRGIQ